MGKILGFPEAEQRLADMVEKRMSNAEMASELGVTERSITRARRALSLSGESASPLTDEEIAWARIVRAEGMPMSWVAETLGCSAQPIQKFSPLAEDDAKEWRNAWLQIKRRPELLELHWEVSPPSKKLIVSKRLTTEH